MFKLSIVVPCFHNEANFPETYQVILTDVVSKLKDVEFEFVFVNDGSKDRTLDKLLALQAQDARVKVVDLTRNFGEFRAIVAGLEVASGDAMVVMSADLQDPPALIVDMYHEFQQGSEVVLACRKARNESKLKNFLANTYYKIVRLLVIKDYPKQGFDFFLIDKTVAQKLVLMQEKNSSIYVQLIWLGYPYKKIEYTRLEREKGHSMWSYSKRINLFLDTFVVFSHKPIRFFSSIGILFSLFGFGLALYYLYEKLAFNHNPSGWTSLIVVMLIIGGFQMIMLGVVGEYLWRTLDESRNRPLYLIRKVYQTHEQSKVD